MVIPLSDLAGSVTQPLMLLRAHKIQLRPNPTARSYYERAAGTARVSHNWCLNVADAYYRLNGETLSDFDLQKLWNTHRKLMLPWTYEVTKYASDSGTKQFCAARANWFSSLKKQKAGGRQPFRKPKIKTKRHSKKSFTIHNSADFRVEGCKLTIQKLKDPVLMTMEVRFPGKIKSVTISEQGKHWYASFLVDISEDYVYPHRCETQAVVGIDLGINAHLTLASDKPEQKLTNPKFYRRYERKLKRAHLALSRKKKGSRNREKARQHLAVNYRSLVNLRTNHIHQMTATIVRLYRWIGMEDLAVANMMKNHSLARALADASVGEIRRQLLYKAEWAGSHLAVADRWFASSKICSVCGYKHVALQLGDREWACPGCGTHHDRDINAARNLEKVARELRDTLNACVTALSEQRSRRKPRWSKGPRAAAKIQECVTPSAVDEL